ncbi:hypothetical protein CA984_38290 [Streptosporangium minutum]|uniref:Uncharacterized protein n=1 Tax=Streptosporangium minutum TaxID=569862 RepID=A0A243QYN5_9ACTN|nr:hypothetical protein CA984_38290 [Streptosporangium minutum]
MTRHRTAHAGTGPTRSQRRGRMTRHRTAHAGTGPVRPQRRGRMSCHRTTEPTGLRGGTV